MRFSTSFVRFLRVNGTDYNGTVFHYFVHAWEGYIQAYWNWHKSFESNRLWRPFKKLLVCGCRRVVCVFHNKSRAMLKITFFSLFVNRVYPKLLIAVFFICVLDLKWRTLIFMFFVFILLLSKLYCSDTYRLQAWSPYSMCSVTFINLYVINLCCVT